MECKLMNICMIKNKEGKVLVQDRTNNWIGVAFPGGKVEKGEGIVESTIREIKEETGLEVFELKLCGLKTWINNETKITNIVFCFKTDKYKGEFIPECNEGKNFWVTMDKVRNLKLADNFEATLNLYENNITEILWKKDNDWTTTLY